MLLTVGKFMMAAALTLATVTTIFVVLFRENPEPVSAAEPVEKTTEQTTGPEDLSQPWLDIPDPKATPEPTSEPAPERAPELEPEPEPKPVAPEPEPPSPEPVAKPEAEPIPVDENDYPLPDGNEIQAAHDTRRYTLPEGAIMGLTVPAMGIYNAPVFDSDRRWALDSGVAHVPETSLPWSNAPQRNTYLAGHRLGWPGTGSHLIFYRLGALGPGDIITLKDRQGRAYRYRVTETFIADPGDSWVMGQVRGRDMVTLQTCTLIPTFDKRIIVRADRI